MSFDVKEYTVELLVAKFDAEEIYAPEYQRKFVWPPERQCKFVESVIIGLPIPFLFFADMPDGRYEVVDGVQRLSTLSQFVGNKLQLNDLAKLDSLGGFKFEDLPLAQRRRFLNRSIRSIVLASSADESTKLDMFERINTGSLAANPAEIRKGALQGPFYDVVLQAASNRLFHELCPVSEDRARRGEREELVARFFAYLNRTDEFRHDVSRFVDKYIREENAAIADSGDLDAEAKAHADEFRRMLRFVKKHFPFGFAKAENSKGTPRVRFEAISVGVAKALRRQPDLVPSQPPEKWLRSSTFASLTTTNASNSAPKLNARIDFVVNKLLEAV